MFCDTLCENMGYEPDKDTLFWIPRAKGSYLDREPESETHTDVGDELSPSEPLTVVFDSRRWSRYFVL
ncbi:dDENN domain protein [Aspergillus luchuensis]|uniref:DDENN domain protein n=1 Tax=Aspergillus kawachii TaxID=1069201 RepID=A0A146FSC3_ASPKA|nr:dDENN domain protein [Aspergillus luchuensis]